MLLFYKSIVSKNVFEAPKDLTSELCEDFGIHIGDGNLYVGKGNYSVSCFGDAINDMEYYRGFLIPLRKRLYGIDFKQRIADNNTLVIYTYSKDLVNFYKSYGIMPGRKTNTIDIPDRIKESCRENIIACIRGIIDTDFAVSIKRKDNEIHDYPVIGTHFASKRLVKTLEKLLGRLGFRVYTKYDVFRVDKRGVPEAPHWIFLNGKNNIERWFSLVGSHNPKHITKYKVFKKFGFSPPFTTTNDRMRMLGGLIDPRAFYDNEEEFRQKFLDIPKVKNRVRPRVDSNNRYACFPASR